MDINDLWKDPMWRECFRLARDAEPRAVLGYSGPLAFDVFDLDVSFASAVGVSFGAPWVGAFRIAGEPRRFALISGRVEMTVGNGCDAWDAEHCHVDVQIAATLDDLVRLAMTAEERSRLGYPPV